MKVGDLVSPRRYPKWIMLVTQMFLDGKHVRLQRGSRSSVGVIKELRVVNDTAPWLRDAIWR